MEKINKPLVRPREKKMGWVALSKDIEGTIKQYYEELYAHRFYYLDESDHILDTTC